MARPILSLEDSEVDKVYNEEHNSEDASNSNELSSQVKALIDENKEKEENPEEEQAADDAQPVDSNDASSSGADSEEVTDEESAETDEEADTDDSDDTAGDEADEEDSGDALNSASEMIMESFQIILATESEAYTNPVKIANEGVLGTVGHAVGTAAGVAANAVLTAGGYLANAGIRFGPPLLKKLGKTIVYALGMTLKGLHKSTKALQIAIEDSQNSYIKLGQRLKNIESSLELLKKEGIEEIKDGSLYTKESIINSINSSSEFKPQQTLSVYKKFLKEYMGDTIERAESSYYGMRQLFGRISASEISDTISMMNEDYASKGLVAGNIPGYSAINADVDVYHYPVTLPGNLLFMAYLPKKHLNTAEEIYTAYKSSRFFVGLNLNHTHGFRKVAYLTTAEISSMHKEISEIREWGDGYLKNLKELGSYKKLIEYNLRSMAQKISAKVTASKEELEAIKFVTLKIYFFQKCFIRDMVDIERTNRRILLSYVRYMEASVLALAQTSKS